MKNFKITEMLKAKNIKIKRVNKKEVELEDGNIYQFSTELDEDPTIEEFQEILNESRDFFKKVLENGKIA